MITYPKPWEGHDHRLQSSTSTQPTSMLKSDQTTSRILLGHTPSQEPYLKLPNTPLSNNSLLHPDEPSIPSGITVTLPPTSNISHSAKVS
jgi:hypothetical protein